MVKLVNRAKMTIASGGAGNITLGTAVDGYQTFADAGVSDADTLRYTIEDGDDWEVGTGVYTASGTTLARTPTESSNSGNAITATTDSVVFVTAAAADLGPTVHSTIDDLIAQTGMTLGDTALVTGTNKLYMYTTSGWFLVATMTNTSPSAITGAAASYILAIDGTATVITLAATDPEGFPITFSHTVSTGSLGSTATVTQGTGANANVFTVTPSSNSAHFGSFSLTFSASDGSSVSQTISSFELSFGPNLSTASLDSDSFALGSQGGNVRGLAFSSDGTKMFTVTSDDYVYQYSLTNGYSMASGNVTYDNVSFSVASQESSAQGIAFNSNGSKMFIIGAGSSAVQQYSLTNNYNLSSGVSHDTAFSIVNQESNSTGLAFNSDGSKMFVIGRATQKVHQYSLTNNFNLSSGVTYDNVSFSVGSQDNTPSGLAFKNNGSKMFMIGRSSDKIWQYALTNNFNLSSGVTYDNVSFSVSGQETSPTDLAFNSAQSKMFVLGYSNTTVYQYDVS